VRLDDDDGTADDRRSRQLRTGVQETRIHARTVEALVERLDGSSVLPALAIEQLMTPGLGRVDA
jgi:phytoene/squalene synthetase